MTELKSRSKVVIEFPYKDKDNDKVSIEVSEEDATCGIVNDKNQIMQNEKEIRNMSEPNAKATSNGLKDESLQNDVKSKNLDSEPQEIGKQNETGTGTESEFYANAAPLDIDTSTDESLQNCVKNKNKKQARQNQNDTATRIESKHQKQQKQKEIVTRIESVQSAEFCDTSMTNESSQNGGDSQSMHEFDAGAKRKFHGCLWESFREEKVKKKWRPGEEDDSDALKRQQVVPELSRSQYSLVSCGELTAGAVELWLTLPEEVKYDPALAPFRNTYEKDHGNIATVPPNNRSTDKHKRLPLVNSAPHLHNNLTPTIKFIDEQETVNNNNNVGGIEMGPTKEEERRESDKKMSKMARASHYTKITLLLAVWVFFTLIFLMYNEKEEVFRQSFVAPGEIKDYMLPKGAGDIRALQVTLRGPFLTDQNEQQLNKTQLESMDTMEVWLEAMPGNHTQSLTSQTWTLVLDDPADIDFSIGETRSEVLQAPGSDSQSYAIRMRQSSDKTVPLTFSYETQPLDQMTGVICSCVLLCGLYVLIIFEIINRTMAAVIVSTASLAVLSVLGARPSVPELVSWLDVETLLLLFSMMLLVAIMAETGMFDFLAVFTFEVTKGKMWPLINLLCAITALLSTFLDNVTTVLLMTPVTIRLCEVMELDPVPILMSMVLYSNIGGTATPVGDPPNVIIASNKAVVGAGINFTNFTMHMTLGIVFVCVQTYLQLRYIYRDTNKLRLNVPTDIQELRQQIAIWIRSADSLPHLSKDQHVVKERLNKKIWKLEQQLQEKLRERAKRACPKSTFQSTLKEMKEKYKIRDKPLLVKSSVAITFVVAVFFLHSIPELNRVSLGWTALLGAILLLILADREDLEPILHRVEWSTLLFFAALFVLMEALSKLGLIDFIGGLTESLILKVDESQRLAVALLLMLWVSGVTSAFVDNIPLTTMMVRIVTSLGSNPNIGLPMAPLIWALSFGACLGGNGTLIGASANVVCAGVAEQHGYRISFMRFFQVGFPVMIGHLLVASAYLMICHCAFEWH